MATRTGTAHGSGGRCTGGADHPARRNQAGSRSPPRWPRQTRRRPPASPSWNSAARSHLSPFGRVLQAGDYLLETLVLQSLLILFYHCTFYNINNLYNSSMDSVQNPFAPGAGSKPPELAGREEILLDAKVAIERATAGRPSRGMLLLGLRGVGKTVLLNEIQRMATESGENISLFLEAPEGRSLVEMLVPALRKALLQLSKKERAEARAKKALSALRNFASVFKVKIGEVQIGIEPDPGTADSGE